MKYSTKQRLEVIMGMVEWPAHDPDSIDQEKLLKDLDQVWTMCKNALLDDPVEAEEPRKSVYQRCTENFNNDAQLLKTVEEAGELVQAISKYLVWKIFKKHPDVVRIPLKEGVMLNQIIEESLDVEAMIQQIKHIPFFSEASWHLLGTKVTMGLWRKLEETQ